MPKFTELPGASPTGPPPGLCPGPAGEAYSAPQTTSSPAVFLVPMAAPLPKCFRRACLQWRTFSSATPDISLISQRYQGTEEPMKGFLRQCYLTSTYAKSIFSITFYKISMSYFHLNHFDANYIMMTLDIVINFWRIESFLGVMKSIDWAIPSKNFMAGIKIWLQSIRGQLETWWMIHSLYNTFYAVEVLSVFIIYRVCHLECHLNTIVAVWDGCHAWGKHHLLNAEYLVVL